MSAGRQKLKMINGRNPTTEWTEIAQTLNTVGQELQAQYGEQGIPVKEIEEAAERLGDYARGSLRPSDYCYNIINSDPCSFVHHIFERVERGYYIYLGPSFCYSGSIRWKPKGEKECPVGQWISGCYTLDKDPRPQGGYK